MISHMTPLGRRPAIIARSMLASVCPARLNTPPSLPTIGNIWPGRARSLDCVRSFISARMVFDLSKAEIPVVVFSFASTLIVKFVSCKLELRLSMGSSSSSFERSLVIETQISPRPSFAIKLIVSGLTNSDAMTRSPSFSRSSLSITIIGLPIFISSTAESIELNFKSYS